MRGQRPPDFAKPGEYIEHARRQVGFLSDLAEFHQAQRRQLRGLEHRRAAHGQTRGELPGAEHHGRVPGDDDAGDAEGLAQGHAEQVDLLPERGALAPVCVLGPLRQRIGKEREIVRRARDIVPAALLDRLANIEALDPLQLWRVLHQQFAEATQQLRPLGSFHFRPGTFVKRLTCRGHGLVHILNAGLSHFNQHLVGGRV